MEVEPLALRAEDGDDRHRSVDSTEPVRGAGAELDDLAGIDGEVLVAEEQAEPPVENVEPVVPVVPGQAGRRPDAPGADLDAVGVQPAGGPPVSERPQVQRALLLRFWSDDVTVLTNGAADLGSDDLDRLQRAGVVLEERVVGALRGPGSTLEAVAFTDGSERRCEGLLVAVTLYQRSTLATQLGARIAEPGPVAAEAVAIDTMFRTSIPGLFAAGDVGTQSPSVATAVAAGSTAAAAIVHDLLAEAYVFAPPAPPAGTPHR